MLSRTVSLASTAGKRTFAAASRPLQQAAGAAAPSDKAGAVDPSDPIIAPAAVSERQYKNDYFTKRGYKVADKNWTEWSDLPAPYKYLGVKVDPKHVENAGFLWKAMSDWKLAVPISMLVAMPLYMTGNFPGFDERLELSFITILAGTVIIKEAGPMLKNIMAAGKEARVKALYDAEDGLNKELDSVITSYKNGQAIPETMKTVHTAERALRSIEAAAATTKARIAQRDAIVAELEYLVQLRSAAGAAAEGEVLKAARASVESSLEKDAALQGKTIDAAIKALKAGAVEAADDVVAPAFQAAVAKAAKELAAKPSANPLTQAAQVEIFNKRFGYEGGARKVGAASLRSPLSYIKQ